MANIAATPDISCALETLCFNKKGWVAHKKIISHPKILVSVPFYSNREKFVIGLKYEKVILVTGSL